MLIALGEDASPTRDWPRRSRRRRRPGGGQGRVRGDPRHAGGHWPRAPTASPKQRPFRLKMIRLQNELLALTDPADDGKVALGVRDAKTVGDTEIRIRGEAEKLGPVVPRGFLGVLQVPDAPDGQPAARAAGSSWRSG